jgi:anti-sigma factor RsiW
MGRWRRTTACERAAQWISLELDGELSELEGAALRRHLERCGRCSARKVEIDGFTRLIRQAPLVESSTRAVFALPGSRRAKIVRRSAASLVAAAVLAAGAAALVVPQGPPDRGFSLFALSTQKERLQFADAEQIRSESQTLMPTWPTSPLAVRALW